MIYTNPLTAQAHATINHYLHGRLRDDELAYSVSLLDVSSIQSISDHHTTLLLDVIALGSCQPQRCIHVIDALIRRAMMLSQQALHGLLLHRNYFGMTFYYFALKLGVVDPIIQCCSEWLTFAVSMKFLPKHDYVKLHFDRDSQGNIPLVPLVLTSNVRGINRCFHDINQAMTAGWVSPTVLQDSLLLPNALGSRVLNLALRLSQPDILRDLLLHAKLACDDRWITSAQYRSFLLNHCRAHEGYSPLHEVLLSGSPEKFSLYIKAVLQAILDNRVSLDDFKSLLIQPNGCQFSPMHQAMNSASLDIAELFLNVFKSFFLKEEYRAALCLKARGASPRCHVDKQDAQFINFLVSSERDRLLSNDESPSGVHEHSASISFCGRSVPTMMQATLDVMHHVIAQHEMTERRHVPSPATLRFFSSPTSRDRHHSPHDLSFFFEYIPMSARR